MIAPMVGASNADPLAGREIIFEFHPVGAYVRVAAIDAASLTEISIQGPSSAPQELLKRNALKRLEFVLKKKGIL
jgi:hypothetical protein